MFKPYSFFFKFSHEQVYPPPLPPGVPKGPDPLRNNIILGVRYLRNILFFIWSKVVAPIDYKNIYSYLC